MQMPFTLQDAEYITAQIVAQDELYTAAEQYRGTPDYWADIAENEQTEALYGE